MSRRSRSSLKMTNSSLNNGTSNNYGNHNSSASSSTFRCRSFMLGVALTSLTWIASMYLYWNLTSTSINNKHNPEADNPEFYIPLRELSRRANLFKNFKKTIEDAPSNGIWKLKFKQIIDEGLMFKNSKQRADLKSKIINDPFSDSIGLVKTIEDKKLKHEGFKTHAFNALISSRLEYNRSIPDTRHDRYVRMFNLLCFFFKKMTDI